MNLLYVVFDKVAQDVGAQVIVAKRDEVAVRSFFDALSSSNLASVMAKHPEDYDLLCVGQMRSDGQILPEGLASGDVSWLPRVVVTGAQFVAMRDAQAEASK